MNIIQIKNFISSHDSDSSNEATYTWQAHMEYIFKILNILGSTKINTKERKKKVIQLSQTKGFSCLDKTSLETMRKKKKQKEKNNSWR